MQKRVLAIHDLAGFGRSSLVPITGVLCAGGHQCVPLPTALFSTHTAIEGAVMRDLTDDMPRWTAHYEALGLRFDAVYAGFLGAYEQFDKVEESAARLCAPGGLILIDPVMGDGGKVYRTYTADMCRRMQKLCRLAHLITPNLTEAALLLDKEPSARPESPAESTAWVRELAERYRCDVVLTGLEGGGGTLGVLTFSEGRTAFFEHTRIGQYYPGTGDLFAAALLGGLLSEKALPDAAAAAAQFVRACIGYTAEQGTDPLHGVQFETQLYRLMGQRKEEAPAQRKRVIL